MSDDISPLRILEAVLFAAAEPLDMATLASRLPEDTELEPLLSELSSHYENRGVHLVKIGNKWALRTAPDVAPFLRLETESSRKLSQAAIECLAVIAYHQPVTRAEIEEIRGRSLSKGTLDTLLEAGWIKPKGKRRTPGRPTTWGTSDAFLDHFGLESIGDLPGQEELKAAGLVDKRPAITAYSRMNKSMREALGLDTGEEGGEETASTEEGAENGAENETVTGTGGEAAEELDEYQPIEATEE